MSSHSKGVPIHGDFCETHLKYVMSCSDAEIERVLPSLSAHDLNRLRKLLRGPLKGTDGELPAQPAEKTG